MHTQNIKCIIVMGSSNSHGKTYEAVQLFQDKYCHCDFLDLADYSFSDFDYKNKNHKDDFLPLINKILNYELIILATPIYWYSMSSIMKRFVDRLTDLLHFDQQLLFLLKLKQIAVITSYGTYPDGREGFEEQFIKITNYLNIKYLGCYFYYSKYDTRGINENDQQLINFINKLNI